MDYLDLNNKTQEIVKQIINKNLHSAFSKLNKLIIESGQAVLLNKYENYYSTYQNMLKFSFEYQDDPEKEKIYNHLLRDLLTLNDDVKSYFMQSQNLFSYFSYKNEVKEYFNIDAQQSQSLVDELAFEKEIEEILMQNDIQKEQSDQHVKHIDRVFKIIWLTDSYQQAQVDLVDKVIKSEHLQWHDKSLVVTALTLSVLRHFDEKKILVLFDIYEHGQDQVWHRAFIGLCLAFMLYDNRLKFYPDIMNRLKLCVEKKEFGNYLELFSLQYIWQKESKKIAERINKEFLPDMMKMKSIIEEKLDLDNVVSSDPLKDKNPDWEDYLKDSPDIYKKFEDLQKLQSEGADIFMGAFSMLKQFPFFNNITNWFVPFYVEHPAIESMMGEMKEKEGFANIIKGLSSSYFLCNSDKYSFCHNLKYVLGMQNPGVLDMFKTELDAMNEMADSDAMIEMNTKHKSIFTQYLQDLYRFFMLHPSRKEFENVFSGTLNIHDKWFVDYIAGDSKIIHKLGEFYFNQDYYEKALKIFESISKKDNNSDLLEKIAFCHQRLGNIHDAIKYYNMALLLEKNRKWKLQQLAFCYRKKGEYNKALELNLEREKIDPEDLVVQADIGQVYLGLEDYENALKYYFKVEYLAPDNKGVQRPLAWCSFMIGKLDAAKKYFQKVCETGGGQNDLINLGHVLWCLGERKEAIEKYKAGLIASKNNTSWFDKAMKEDSKHLEKHGIEPLDVSLMSDYLKMGI